jgi:hypothetical protein
MIGDRLGALLAMTAGATLLGACQLVSGLSGLHEQQGSQTGAGGHGGMASSSSGTGGRATVGSSTSASVSSTDSATGSSVMASSSTGGCTIGSMTDPQNCGSCGHDCGAGACTSGACQKFLVATATAPPDTLVSDGTHLFWGITGSMQLGEIHRANIDGTPTPDSLVTNNVAPLALAVDAFCI